MDAAAWAALTGPQAAVLCALILAAAICAAVVLYKVVE